MGRSRSPLPRIQIMTSRYLPFGRFYSLYLCEEENIMDAIYKVVGIIARMNERMSHLRINFVPVNISMMCGLSGVFLVLSAITGGMLIKGGGGLEYWGTMVLFSLFTAF